MERCDGVPESIDRLYGEHPERAHDIKMPKRRIKGMRQIIINKNIYISPSRRLYSGAFGREIKKPSPASRNQSCSHFRALICA